MYMHVISSMRTYAHMCAQARTHTRTLAHMHRYKKTHCKQEMKLLKHLKAGKHVIDTC